MNGIAVKKGDFLRLGTWAIGGNGVRANLNFRPDSWFRRVFGGLTKALVAGSDPFSLQIDVLSNSDRSLAVTTLKIDVDGVIDSARCIATSGGSPAGPGELWVALSLSRGPAATESFVTLAEGYLHDGNTPSFPSKTSATPSPFDGPGRVYNVALGNPGAGANYAAFTVPTGARNKIRGFDGTLVAAAVAVNRKPVLSYDDGTNVFTRASPGGVATTGQTITFSAAIGLGYSDVNDTAAIAGDQITFSLPDTPALPPGYRVTFTTVNLQGADDWGIGIFGVEEWIDPA